MLPVDPYSLARRREVPQSSQSEVVTTLGDDSTAGTMRLKRILQIVAAGAATSGLTVIVDLEGCPRVSGLAGSHTVHSSFCRVCTQGTDLGA